MVYAGAVQDVVCEHVRDDAAQPPAGGQDPGLLELGDQ